MLFRSQRLSISLPKELAAVLREKAKKQRRSQSAVVADLLLQAKQVEQNRLMEEGYRYYAEELVQFALEAMPLAAEVWEPYETPQKTRRPGSLRRTKHAPKHAAAG